MKTRSIGTTGCHDEFGTEPARPGTRFARRGLVAVALGAGMIVPIATTIAAPAAGAAGCQTTLKLIKGQPVQLNCGPASAKLHYKGKTLSFKGGTCRSDGTGGGGTLSIGKYVDTKGNLGLTGISIAFIGNGLHDVELQANEGHIYINGSGTATKLAPTGTIKGTVGSTPFTVLWKCGGAFVKS
jgi:hypothetical protein